MDLNNKVVLISGASSGIGKAIAIEVAKAGGNLAIVSRRVELLEALKAELESNYQVRVLVLQKDLTKTKEIEATVQQTMAFFGRIDYLINSSGIGIFKKATEFNFEEIEQTFKINTYAMIYLSQLVAREMIIQNNPGHILFVASVAGKIATPSSSIYSASKFAIIGYANSLRLELKKFNIAVTTINPGPVKTDFFNHDPSSKSYYERIKKYSLDPNVLAQDVVKHMIPNRRKRELNRPRFFSVANIMYQFFPKIGDLLAGDVFNFKEDK